MFGLNNIIKLATAFTFAKFPEAAKDYKKHCVDLFDVANMVADELTEKNGDLFVKDYTKNFVDIKDLARGDKNVFSLPRLEDNNEVKRKIERMAICK